MEKVFCNFSDFDFEIWKFNQVWHFDWSNLHWCKTVLLHLRRRQVLFKHKKILGQISQTKWQIFVALDIFKVLSSSGSKHSKISSTKTLSFNCLQKYLRKILEQVLVKINSTATADYFRPVLTDLTVQLPDHMINIPVTITMTNNQISMIMILITVTNILITMVIIKITAGMVIVSVKRSIKTTLCFSHAMNIRRAPPYLN